MPAASHNALSPATRDRLQTLTARWGWMTPTVVISLLVLLFAAGRTWGASEVSEEIAVGLARIEERLNAHERLLVHPGAMPRTEVTVTLDSINRRVDQNGNAIAQLGDLLREALGRP